MAIRLATNSAPFPSVVFHGDSFTLGLHTTIEANTWRLLMTAYLQSFGGASTTFRQATSGAKMTAAGTITDAASAVTTYDPDLVFLAYGINDCTGAGGDPATEEDFDTATRAVLDEYVGRTVQVQSIPWCNWGVGSETIYARAIAFNAILADAASDYSHTYVDVWTGTVYDTTLISRSYQVSHVDPFVGDNFHYGDAGHVRLFSLHRAALVLPGMISRSTVSRDASDARSVTGSRAAI